MKNEKDLKPLIDGDPVTYRAGFAADSQVKKQIKEEFPGVTDEELAQRMADMDYLPFALGNVKTFLEYVTDRFNPEYKLYLHGGGNFREKIATILPYKGNRDRTHIPKYKNEIIEEVPEVDAVLGTTSYGDILKAIREAMEGKHFQEFKDIDYLPEKLGKRVLTTGGHFGYLKIAEGCDKHCTYCIIPKLRGKFRSVPMERLVTQAKEMAEEGVKELILVAQETTVYGTDIYGKKSLHILLKELCKIKGIRWIRVL